MQKSQIINIASEKVYGNVQNSYSPIESLNPQCMQTVHGIMTFIIDQLLGKSVKQISGKVMILARAQYFLQYLFRIKQPSKQLQYLQIASSTAFMEFQSYNIIFPKSSVISFQINQKLIQTIQSFQSMTKTGFFLLLAIVAATATYTDLAFDFTKAKIQRQAEYDVFVFPCYGGSGKYQYEYTNLPEDWFSYQDKIYAPRERYNRNHYYGIKVGIFDKIANKILRRSVVFNPLNQLEDCFDLDYDFDIRSEEKIRNIVKERKGRSQRHIDIYYEFPAIHELESYINDGDVVYLRKVIDDAINSRRDCTVISEFLNRFLSAIQLRLSVLTSTSEITRQEIVVIEEELVFLRRELDERRNSHIDIKIIKRKIEEFRRQIDGLISENRVIEGRISQKRIDIEDSEAEIFDLKVNVIAQAEETAVIADQEVKKINVEISELQKRLAVLQSQRNKYLIDIREARKTIAEAQRRIKVLGSIIVESQREIRTFQVRIEQNLIAIRNLEARISDLQEEINQGGDNTLIIRELEIKIREKTTLLANKRAIVKQTERVINILGIRIKQFERIINKHYYQCYEVIEIEDDTTNNNEDEESNNEEIITPHTAFTSYLKKIFGYTPSSNIRSRFSGEEINFKHLTIFSPVWSKVYGIPYSAGYGNNMDIMETEFSCETYGEDDLEVFDGKIVSINSNFINVKAKTGDEYTVHLGGCTRIETVSQEKELPEVGDNIFFKGRFKKHGSRREYNGYHLTCY